MRFHQNAKSPLLLEQERGQEPQPQRKGPFLHYTADRAEKQGGHYAKSKTIDRRRPVQRGV